MPTVYGIVFMQPGIGGTDVYKVTLLLLLTRRSVRLSRGVRFYLSSYISRQSSCRCLIAVRLTLQKPYQYLEQTANLLGMQNAKNLQNKTTLFGGDETSALQRKEPLCGSIGKFIMKNS